MVQKISGTRHQLRRKVEQAILAYLDVCYSSVDEILREIYRLERVGAISFANPTELEIIFTEAMNKLYRNGDIKVDEFIRRLNQPPDIAYHISLRLRITKKGKKILQTRYRNHNL